MESILLNKNGDVLEQTTTIQMSPLEYDNTNTLLSIGSNLTVATLGTLIMDVPDSFVKKMVEISICEFERHIILYEPGPKIQNKPSSIMFFCIKIVLETFLFLEYISCSKYMVPN